MKRYVRRTLPVVCLVVLIGLLLQVRPTQLLVTLGPQQTVYTNNVLAGVHTRFVDEAEPWKIKRSLEMIRAMGAPWIVEFFPWAYYEKAKGQFDFGNADRIVDHANRQGWQLRPQRQCRHLHRGGADLVASAEPVVESGDDARPR